MSNFDKANLEGKPLWKLTDKQVLDAMRGRGNELATAETLASLCRVFHKAAETNLSAAPGLLAAIGLTQIYGLGIAPGHEDHPFKDVDKNMSVASILSGVTLPKVERYVPPPVVRRPRQTNPHDRFSVPGKTFDLDAHMEGQREITARPTSDALTAFPNAKHMDGEGSFNHVDFEQHSMQPLHVERGTMTGRTLRSVQNIPRELRGPSKVGVVGAIILGFPGDLTFTAQYVHGLTTANSGITYQDVQNAIVKLRKNGRIEKLSNGCYGLVKDAA